VRKGDADKTGREEGAAVSEKSERQSDDAVLEEYTRVRVEADVQIIDAGVVTWLGHWGERSWVEVVRLPAAASADEVGKARRKVLQRRKFFAVCKECCERMPRGFVEEGICTSCLQRNHGVIF
jgi:hypothetical protein